MRFWVGIIIPKKIYKELFKLEKEISENTKLIITLIVE
jgi:hypothetical protein